tara:strand:+ start:619 stop:753 length:135 start_codon:yes stop_codon:yes gene_type:complete
MYNQIIAITETIGIDAKRAPIKELRFETSDIKTINKAVITNFSI